MLKKGAGISFWEQERRVEQIVQGILRVSETILYDTAIVEI